MESTITNLEKYIENTILKPDSTDRDVIKLLEETVKYNFLGVCINPVFVKLAREHLNGEQTRIVTVIGFPLGANLTSIKAYETQKALEDGADEFDMVINIGAIKAKNYNEAESDIKGVVGSAGGKVVKVILETDLLTQSEIVDACKICVNAGANFVKTSTGFVKGGVGATAENIKLMHKTVSPYGLQVKASGGVKDRKSAIEMIEAGASRIGTSSGINIVVG